MGGNTIPVAVDGSRFPIEIPAQTAARVEARVNAGRAGAEAEVGCGGVQEGGMVADVADPGAGQRDRAGVIEAGGTVVGPCRRRVVEDDAVGEHTGHTPRISRHPSTNRGRIGCDRAAVQRARMRPAPWLKAELPQRTQP